MGNKGVSISSRHGVLWEMDSVASSWMECPLEELMGTPAGDCDILGLFTPGHFMRFL